MYSLFTEGPTGTSSSVSTAGGFSFTTGNTGTSTGTGALSPFVTRVMTSRNPPPPPPIVLPNGQISVHSISSSNSFLSKALSTDHTNAVVIPTRSAPRTLGVTPSTRGVGFQTVVTTVVPSVTRPAIGVTRSIPRPNDITAPLNRVFESEISISMHGSGHNIRDFLKSISSPATSARQIKPTQMTMLDTHPPDVRVIEIPILPEGQTAAFLNITRDVRPSLVETLPARGKTIKPVSPRRTMVSRDGNLLRLRVGESVCKNTYSAA